MQKDINIRDNLVWTAGNGDPMHEVLIPRRITSRMGTAKMKQEEEANTRVVAREE